MLKSAVYVTLGLLEERMTKKLAKYMQMTRPFWQYSHIDHIDLQSHSLYDL